MKTDVVIKNKKRQYTQEECDYILDKVGHMKVETIAENLGRSPEAIRSKISRLAGTENIEAIHGYYSTVELGRLFSKSETTVLNWIRVWKLPAKQLARCSSGKKAGYSIDIDDFFKWLKKNKHNVNIDFTKFNLYDIPNFPQWFHDDYRSGVSYTTKNGGVVWTKEEEEKLKYLFYKENKTLKEIASILERSPDSVKCKHLKLTRMINGGK